MNRHTRRSPRRQSDRKIWVFSELNSDLSATALARLLARVALETADAGQRSGRRSPLEADDE